MLKIDDSLPLRYHTSSSSYASGSGNYYTGYRGGSGSLSSAGFPDYFRRILDYHQMDFESTFEDMTMLCSTNPQRVYKMAYYRKQTKNHWARDDPAFAVIEVLFLIAASAAYGLALHVHGLVGYALLMLRAVVIDWLLVGLTVATLCRWAANKYLLQLRSHSVEQVVEWRYAFDIHCNAFLPYFLINYVVHFFFLPLFLGKSFLAMAFANAVYCLGICVYFYITHLGYRALPFLHRTEVFLYPATAAILFFILFTSLGTLGERYRFNATRMGVRALYPGWQ